MNRTEHVARQADRQLTARSIIDRDGCCVTDACLSGRVPEVVVRHQRPPLVDDRVVVSRRRLLLAFLLDALVDMVDGPVRDAKVDRFLFQFVRECRRTNEQAITPPGEVDTARHGVDMASVRFGAVEVFGSPEDAMAALVDIRCPRCVELHDPWWWINDAPESIFVHRVEVLTAIAQGAEDAGHMDLWRRAVAAIEEELSFRPNTF